MQRQSEVERVEVAGDAVEAHPLVESLGLGIRGLGLEDVQPELLHRGRGEQRVGDESNPDCRSERRRVCPEAALRASPVLPVV